MLITTDSEGRVDAGPVGRPVGPRGSRAASRLSLLLASVLLLAVGAGSCWASDAGDQAPVVLAVVNLDGEVQGWRLRVEARSPELDGSPTFYFSDSERVDGSSMTSAETSLGPRPYMLIAELADPATNEVRRCEAGFEAGPGESLDLTLDATSMAVPAGSGALPECELEVERTPPSE